MEMKHPGLCKLFRCIYCDATFKSERMIDNHILRKRKHPDFSKLITSKISDKSKQQCTRFERNKSEMDVDSQPIREFPSKVIIQNEREEDAEAISELHLNSFSEIKKTEVHWIKCEVSDTEEFGFRTENQSIMGTDSKTFKIGELIKEWDIKEEIDENADTMLLPDRMKSEHSNIDWSESDFKKKNILELKVGNETESRIDLDIKVKDLTQELIIKDESGTNTHLIRKHPDFVTSVAKKVYECIHCNATFKNKRSLDDHIIKKHPNFITSVNRKLNECTKCNFKTVTKRNLKRHMLIHPETDSKLNPCNYCYATFKREALLTNHIIKKHPNFNLSVAKIYECTECAYKTVIKNYLVKHMSTHSETVSSDKLNTCIQCNTKYKRKSSLEEHLIRKHPDSITTLAKKIYECTECTHKTTFKYEFDKHLSMHPQTSSSFKLRTCIHCNATFKNKISLDEHVIRKHPNFITSVTRKLYECAKCAFKTTYKRLFEKHISTHFGTT